MAKKSTWIKVLAGVGLAVGAGAAIATVIKKKSARIGEELDFDNTVYFEDDSMIPMDEEETVEEIKEEVFDDEEAERKVNEAIDAELESILAEAEEKSEEIQEESSADVEDM